MGKKIRGDFYPYAGLSTTLIGIMDSMEEYLRGKMENLNKDKLKEDREKIKKYLQSYPTIYMVKVRAKGAPEGSKKATLRGTYFESYLNTEVAQNGSYAGSRIQVLYIKPRFQV